MAIVCGGYDDMLASDSHTHTHTHSAQSTTIILIFTRIHLWQ